MLQGHGAGGVVVAEVQGWPDEGSMAELRHGLRRIGLM
jgi:hypothetical protein